MSRILQFNRRAAMTMALVALAACAKAQDSVSDAVSLADAFQAHQTGKAVLIDIREPHEHARGVASGAILLPSSQRDRLMAQVPVDASKPVYLICATQNRSSAMLKALREQGGYGHVRYVRGGMTQWMQQGLPTVLPPSKS